MLPSRAECYPGGEFEIEVVSSHELEIRHKDLLPIFDNFPRARTGWVDRLITIPSICFCLHILHFFISLADHILSTICTSCSHQLKLQSLSS